MMATSMEIRIVQKEHLRDLLMVEKFNRDRGIRMVWIKNAILSAETSMEKEDVAYVRELVAQMELE